MLCGDYIVVKHETRQSSARVLTCRSWSCELCRPDRQRQLVAKAISGRPDTFLTLTVNPAVGSDPVDRARRLVNAWRTLRQRAMKRYGYKHLEFLAVMEATKKGEPHLHILLRSKWIDHAWISEQMKALIEAPVVWIERLNSVKKIANYVAKYCGKNPHRFGTLKRYWTSKKYEATYIRGDTSPLDAKPRIERRAQGIDAWLFTHEWLGDVITREGHWYVARKRDPARPEIW